MRRLATSIVTCCILSLVFLNGCGGSGGSAPAPPPPSISISVSPVSSTLTIPTPQTFAATVSNTTNTAVNWSVQEGATGGSITAQGVYTPPSDRTGTYHVVATAQADSSKTATATVTVVAPAPVISTTPSGSAAQGATYTYAAAATDAAGSGITFSLTRAPTGATLTGSTVTWTPDTSQARQPNSFVLKATTGLGMSATQNWTVTPTGDVTVDVVTNYYLESGASNVTSTRTFVAYVPNASGGFDMVQSDTNGTFANMPAGHFWLQDTIDRTLLVWTQANHIDVQEAFPGRPDSTYPSSQLLVSYNIAGLNPTTIGDWIEYSNWDAYSWWSQFIGQVPVGSTTASFTVPSYSALPDGSKGDKSYFSQTSPVSVGSGTFRVITATTGALLLTLSGSNETIDISMNPSVLNSSFRANVKDSEFSALVPALGVNAVDVGATFEVDAVVPLPRSSTSPYFIAMSPYLVKYTGAPITSDQDFGDVYFSNPYPAEWTPRIRYSHDALVPIQADGKNFSLRTSVYYSAKTLPTASTPVRPLVGPVGNPRIHDLPLTLAQSGVGLNPAISWTAPTLGNANYYWVELLEVNAPSTTLIYDFLTKATSITIPTGLQPGKTYVVVIKAIYDPSIDPETGAATDLTSYGTAVFCSATFTP